MTEFDRWLVLDGEIYDTCQLNICRRSQYLSQLTTILRSQTVSKQNNPQKEKLNLDYLSMPFLPFKLQKCGFQKLNGKTSVPFGIVIWDSRSCLWANQEREMCDLSEATGMQLLTSNIGYPTAKARNLSTASPVCLRFQMSFSTSICCSVAIRDMVAGPRNGAFSVVAQRWQNVFPKEICQLNIFQHLQNSPF